ncbi:hypothetical protein [Kitasatospora sp. MBT63]|uniref:hypothetical protein n=1 Tax=Kitasatospora sp. MBT63 TaxID=1444768 RepID=UPI000AD04993|nr:hypothetical protein [Kitasatospora sp. MBT63]
MVLKLTVEPAFMAVVARNGLNGRWETVPLAFRKERGRGVRSADVIGKVTVPAGE